MYGSFDYNALKKRIASVEQNEQRRLQDAKRKRNISAFVDFASNLISLAGYNKGARLISAANSSAMHDESYKKAQERYNSFMHDYKGLLASALLRDTVRRKNGKMPGGLDVGHLMKKTSPAAPDNGIIKRLNN